MATTKRWTRWSRWGGTTLQDVGGDERTVVYVSRIRSWSSDEPFVWSVARNVRASDTPLGWKLRNVAEGFEDTLPAARKAAEAWLAANSIADEMLSQNAASKKNGGVPFWSDEALVHALENEGVSREDAKLAVEGAKHPPAGGWGTRWHTEAGGRIRTDEEQAAIDRVERRNEPVADLDAERAAASIQAIERLLGMTTSDAQAYYDAGGRVASVPNALGEPQAIQRVKTSHGPDVEIVAVHKARTLPRGADFVVEWRRASRLAEEAPQYGARYPLLSRIASGEQAAIDEEIDRFDRRTEPTCECAPEDGDYGSGFHFQACPLSAAQSAAMDAAERAGRIYHPGDERRRSDRPWIPAWRRRELERLENGETAGKDLGVAEDVPSYAVEPIRYTHPSLEKSGEVAVAIGDLVLIDYPEGDADTGTVTAIQADYPQLSIDVSGREVRIGTGEATLLERAKPRKHSVETLRSAFSSITDGSEASAEVLELAIELDVSIFEAAAIRSARAARAMGVEPNVAQRIVEERVASREETYASSVRTYETATIEALLRKAERREEKAGGTDAAWTVDVLRAELQEREADPDLCAVTACTERGRPQVCVYDGRYHHHGRIHYGSEYPEIAGLGISFRRLQDGGWRGLCNPHYELLAAARKAEASR